MTVKVGDKVRIVRAKRDLTVGKEYEVKELTRTPSEVMVIDDVGSRHYITHVHYRTTEHLTTTTPISTLCREKMEDHMGKGEYVRAVKWAQLAEQAEALENE